MSDISAKHILVEHEHEAQDLIKKSVKVSLSKILLRSFQSAHQVDKAEP